MAILNLEEISSDEQEQSESTTYRSQEETKTSTLFNKEKPIENIVNYVQGMAWEVDYYKQIRDVNDSYSNPDPNVPIAHLKYHKIEKLVLFLQTAIDQSNPNEITGEGFINAGMIPNIGDPFVAQLLGGRNAIFVIDNVEKKTYNIHNIYYVTFKLFAFLDTDTIVYRDIQYKTVQEYVYDKNYINTYSAPVILKKDYYKKIDYKKSFIEIQRYYFDTFTNVNKILTRPYTDKTVVDTLLSKFIFKIVNITDININFNLVSDATIVERVGYTLWDVILERSYSKINIVNKDIDIVPVISQNAYPEARELGWMKIDYMLWNTENKVIDLLVDNISIPRTTDYNPPVINPKYIVSDAFYENDTNNMGILELALRDYIDGKMVTSDKLDIMIKQYQMWDPIDQFNLIPILLLLIKDANMNTYINV